MNGNAAPPPALGAHEADIANEEVVANELDTAFKTYEALNAVVAYEDVPSNEPVIPEDTFNVPDNVVDPDTNNEPVIVFVPITVLDPVINTLPLIVFVPINVCDPETIIDPVRINDPVI